MLATSSRLLIPTMLLTMLGSTGCQGGAQPFSFGLASGEQLTEQTFAVGTSVDLMVWGPMGFDMNTTRIKAAAGDGGSTPILITEGRAFFEPECVLGKGIVQEAGEGDVVLATLAGLPLDRVVVRAEPMADLLLVPGSQWDGHIDLPEDHPTEYTLRVLRDENLSLTTVPVGATGAVLRGNPEVSIASNLDFERWEQDIWLDNVTDGWLEISSGEINRRVDVVTVEEQEIVDLRIERSDYTGEESSLRMDTLEGASTSLRIFGQTSEGGDVSGIEADWFVSGTYWGQSEQIQLWGEEASGSACWNELCVSF